MTYDTPVTLQLRPHVHAMLKATVQRVRERLAAAGKAIRVSESALVRNLIRNAGEVPADALAYAIGERIDQDGEVHNLVRLRTGMAPYVQHRVRMGPEDQAKLQREARARHMSTSRYLSALIIAAQPRPLPSDPDWELLLAQTTQTPTTTES